MTEKVPFFSNHAVYGRARTRPLKPIKRKPDDLIHLRTRLSPVLHATSSVLALTPTAGSPSLTLLVSVIIGLPVALWTYKCLMMVLFQRKIIYMGFIPLGTRNETLEDVPRLSVLRKKYCIEEAQIKASGRVKLSALIMSRKNTESPDCIVLYLQGNAGNPLHRIPVFESLLSSSSRINPVIIAPAPRSYWSSTNCTPTQQGILADYRTALYYTASRWPEIPIILYGHSLGGAAAICLLASLDEDRRRRVMNQATREGELGDTDSVRQALNGLILENPFASIPEMVRALYPQRWLPYKHLAPLAWDKWDALSAMRAVSSASASYPYPRSSLDNVVNLPVLPHLARNMLVLVSSKDEVVPPSMGRAIFEARPSSEMNGRNGEDQANLVEIDGALHEDAWRQLQWRKEIGRYLERAAQK